MKKSFTVSTVFLFTLVSSFNVSAQYNKPLTNSISPNLNINKSSFVKGEVFVKFKKTINQNSISALISSNGHQLKMINELSDYKVIKFSNSEKIEGIIALYKSDPNVLLAQPNQIYEIAAFTPPSDLMYKKQWALNNTLSPSSDIDAEKAWELHTDCSLNNTVVAVIDTGVNYLHDDLKNNIWTNMAELNGTPRVDDDGNGYVDDIYGWDFIDNDNSPMDTNGHGTHLAGTIAAEANNFSLGTVGVCWKASIMVIRIGDAAAGKITSARLVAGIDYAIENGATVINLSLGGPRGLLAEQNVITKARDNGVILTIAAGNAAANNDLAASPTYPCNFEFASYGETVNKDDKLDNIICVASLDDDYAMSSFSNFGIKNVDVGAPGRKILSTWPVSTTDFISQGLYTDPLSVLSGWLSFPASPRWQLTTQGTSSLSVLSDPSGFNAVYGPNVNTTVYQTFTAPVADALTVDFYKLIDIPLQAGNQDYTSVVYGIGDVVPAIEMSFTAGSRTGGPYGNEIPKDCMNSTCSFGAQLVSDGNTVVGIGVDILGFRIQAHNFDNSAYAESDGTSMAAPHVAGLAALVKSYNPNYTYKDVVESVMNGGDSLAVLQDKTVTGKAINAFGSLTYINKPTGVSGSYVKK